MENQEEIDNVNPTGRISENRRKTVMESTFNFIL